MSNDRKKKRVLALIFSGIFVLVLPVILILLGWFLDNLFNFLKYFIFPLNLIIGIPLIIIGIFFAIWSNIDLFTKGEGSPIPTNTTQTQKLVIKGPYKYCRNPMTFGYYLMFLGIGFLINSLSYIILISSLVLILLIIYIKLDEENKLEKRFGEDYLQYKRKTSFMIPWIQKKSSDN